MNCLIYKTIGIVHIVNAMYSILEIFTEEAIIRNLIIASIVTFASRDFLVVRRSYARHGFSKAVKPGPIS